MYLFGLSTTTAIFFSVVIILPFGNIAVGVRPTWTKEEWATELENVRQKHFPDIDAGVDGRLPQFIECGLNPPVKMFTVSEACNDDVRKVLLNEVLLRKQIRSFNEDCNSYGTKEGERILNPPENLFGIDFQAYGADWQDILIDSKLQFCDPGKYLRCSQQKKCVCHLNSIWTPASDVRPGIKVKNTCAYFENKECTNALEITIPRCRDENNNCYSLGYDCLKEREYCVNPGMGNNRLFLLAKLKSYFGDLKNPLGFGKKCNFKVHNRFFTYTKEEDENFDVRLQNLEDIQERREKFCDLQQLLTCGPSDICECISPTSRVADKCVLPDEFNSCTLNLKLEPIVMNKSILASARDKLMTGFAKSVSPDKCGGKLTCQTDMTELYCTCPPGTTGLDCNEPLTKFLSHVRVPSLPTEVSGYAEKVKIFSDFNKLAFGFEKMFKLREGALCHWESQNEAEILVAQIRKLMFPLTIMTTRQYEHLGKEIQKFSPSPQGICKDTLRCQYSSQECVRQSRQKYLQDLVNELEKSKTLKCKEKGCSKFTNHLDVVMFDGNQTLFYGGGQEMEYFQIIQQHSDLFKSKAKFCVVSGSCSGSIPRTCDCQVGDEKKEMNTMKNKTMNVTQSFASNCDLPNNFIFFTYVATFFVVSNY